MKAPPTILLDGEFVLEPWKPEDAASHRALAEDAAAARFFGWTVEEARAQPDSHYLDVVRQFHEGWVAGTRFSLAIRQRATGEAVGAVEARPVGDSVEVSYVVAAAFRGQGLAPRAVDGLLGWVTRELGATKAVLVCDLSNIASQRVAKKCGFTPASRAGNEVRFTRSLANSAR